MLLLARESQVLRESFQLNLTHAASQRLSDLSDTVKVRHGCSAGKYICNLAPPGGRECMLYAVTPATLLQCTAQVC